jgi:hypothetical protein
MSKKKKKHFKRIKLVEGGYYGDYQYGYVKTGHTIREKLNDKRGCSGEYRVKEVKKGVKVLLCITKKKGKRGGQTKALAILRDDTRITRYKKHYLKKEPEVVKALKKAEKIKEKLNKKNKKQDKSKRSKKSKK